MLECLLSDQNSLVVASKQEGLYLNETILNALKILLHQIVIDQACFTQCPHHHDVDFGFIFCYFQINYEEHCNMIETIQYKTTQYKCMNRMYLMCFNV